MFMATFYGDTLEMAAIFLLLSFYKTPTFQFCLLNCI